MNILHYLIGPRRGGGLNRYARDLAVAQMQSDHNVTMLYPGGGIFPARTASIQTARDYKGVRSFCLKGGKPVPLLEGLGSPEMILGDAHRLSDTQVQAFYAVVRPDVLHIHTWMGFPEELLPFFKKHGCKLVYTTHDYFGLCPKVNFIDSEGRLCEQYDNVKCSRCNAHAPSEHFLALRNCEFLMRFKELLKPVLNLRKENRPSGSSIECNTQDYDALREHYLSLLRQCNVIHCNSQVSKRIYERYLPNAAFRVLPITHGGIHWQPQEETLDASRVRIGFSGPTASFKGLPLLLDVLKRLPQTNWQLDVWGTGITKTEGPVRYRGNYSDPREAFCELDLLVVPSIWHETFGFIVAEALSSGVPVLCADTVGAQCLVDSSMVYHGEAGLRDRLADLLGHPEQLKALRKKLIDGQQITGSMDNHASDMINLYGNCQ